MRARKSVLGMRMKGEGASRAPGSGSGVAAWALLLLDPMCWAQLRPWQKFGVCSRRLRRDD